MSLSSSISHGEMFLFVAFVITQDFAGYKFNKRHSYREQITKTCMFASFHSFVFLESKNQPEPLGTFK